MTNLSQYDVAVIGAGMAGLVCARQLQQMGYRVVVVEKSRGLGGRLATRRLAQNWADHGVRCLEVQGDLTRTLIEEMGDRLHRWNGSVLRFENPTLVPTGDHRRYVSATGLTTIAKALGQDLEIWRGQRVTALHVNLDPSSDSRWSLSLDPLPDQPDRHLTARTIALTIPAPQALALLEPLQPAGLPAEFVENVRSVEFNPCLTAIAQYPPEAIAPLPWQAVQFPPTSALDWVAHEGSKQGRDTPVFVMQSSASFARQHLEAKDLEAVGRELLRQTATTLAVPWLEGPTLLQVHRWRYAFVQNPLSDRALFAPLPLPLVCGGDWCGGTGLEDAMASGLAIAAILREVIPGSSG